MIFYSLEVYFIILSTPLSLATRGLFADDDSPYVLTYTYNPRLEEVGHRSHFETRSQNWRAGENIRFLFLSPFS